MFFTKTGYEKTFIYIFLFSSFTYSQTLKGVFSVTPIKGIGDDTKLDDKSKKPMFFSYSYSNNKSIQELISKESTTIDTIFITDDRIKDKLFETTDIVIRPYKIIHFKDFGNKIYRLESSRKNEDLVNEDTSIKDSIPNYEWVLGNEIQTIAGYTCKKATTIKNVGRSQQITAWYCENIPINDGPMDFSGLPGLILQIEINKNTIVKFEKLKHLKDESIEIKEPDNNTKMLTISEYINKMMNGD